MSDNSTQHYYPYHCSTGRWTMVATVLASSMAFIDSTALNVILPSLQKDLNASGLDLFWVLNSYLLMLAALIIVGGSLGDKLGRVKIFKAGIIIFTVSSIVCGFSPNVNFLIVARGFQGIGGALMIPGSLSIISAVFDPSVKGKAIGTWSAATTIVTICGPILGGALADMGLWRLIFFINVPLGVFSIWILTRKVPESYDPSLGKLDIKGACVLTSGLILLTLSLLELPELGYTHPLVMTSGLLGIVALIGFIWIEKKSNEPMMPLSLFNKRTFSGVNLLTFFLYAGMGGMMLFLSLNIIQIQGYTQLQAGLTFLPFSFTMVLLARRMGSLTDRYGAKTFLIIGPALTGIGMLWFANIGMTDGPSDYWTTFLPGMLIFSVGMSITVVPLTTKVMSCVSSNQSGIASGINNSISRLSGTFINATLGAFALFVFAGLVENQLPGILGDDMKTYDAVMAETINLGEAKAPDSLSTQQQFEIDNILKGSFIKTYQGIAYVCAGLAFLSAAIASAMIAGKNES